jgi:hypothetical protein
VLFLLRVRLQGPWHPRSKGMAPPVKFLVLKSDPHNERGTPAIAARPTLHICLDHRCPRLNDYEVVPCAPTAVVAALLPIFVDPAAGLSHVPRRCQNLLLLSPLICTLLVLFLERRLCLLLVRVPVTLCIYRWAFRPVLLVLIILISCALQLMHMPCFCGLCRCLTLSLGLTPVPDCIRQQHSDNCDQSSLSWVGGRVRRTA